MIGDSSFHRWRDPDGFVQPAEVVIGEVQRERGPVIFELAAESIRQAAGSKKSKVFFNTPFRHYPPLASRPAANYHTSDERTFLYFLRGRGRLADGVPVGATRP